MSRIPLDALRLGEELKRRLAPARHDQKKVVLETGIQQGTVSNLLKGKFKVLSARVREICEYAEIDPMDYALDKAAPCEADFVAVIRAIEKLGPAGSSAAKLVLKALHTVMAKAEG